MFAISSELLREQQVEQDRKEALEVKQERLSQQQELLREQKIRLGIHQSAVDDQQNELFVNTHTKFRFWTKKSTMTPITALNLTLQEIEKEQQRLHIEQMSLNEEQAICTQNLQLIELKITLNMCRLPMIDLDRLYGNLLLEDDAPQHQNIFG